MGLAPEGSTSKEPTAENDRDQYQLNQAHTFALQTMIAPRDGSKHQSEKSCAEHT